MNCSGWEESNKSNAEVPDYQEDPERVKEDRRLQADDSLPVGAVRADSVVVCPSANGILSVRRMRSGVVRSGGQPPLSSGLFELIKGIMRSHFGT